MIKLKGEVVSSDVTANTVTVKDQAGTSETYTMVNNVTIKKAGKNLTLTDITAGNKITLYYDKIVDKKIITSIYVM